MNIIKQGNNHQFFNEIEILQTLPVANYELTWNAMGVCSLMRVDNFELPEKIYDVEAPFRHQILTTFRAKKGNVGVLLDGYKGQGKTVTSKLLCYEAEIPVILITRPVPASIDFVSFLMKIKQEFILFTDEFEKIFGGSATAGKDTAYHSQDVFLTFMDGVRSQGHKRLFLITSNNGVNDKFINRPSRIRYYKKYEFMDKGLFDMILEDKLTKKQHEKDLRDNLPLTDCTIDLLCTIIEEIEIHDLPYSQFKDFFNHKPKKIYYQRYILRKDKWEFKDTISDNREITRDSVYIGGQSNTEIVKVENPYIYYKAKEYRLKDEPLAKRDGSQPSTVVDSEDEGNDLGTSKYGYFDVFYRLEKSEGTKFAF